MGLEHLEFTKKILPPEEAFVIANEHYAHALPNSKALWGTRRKWITMTAPYSSQYMFIAITAKMRHVWSVLPPAPLARIPSGSQCFSYKSPPPPRCYFPSTEGSMEKKLYIHEGSIPRQLQISKL